ncbi:hypothetical protein H8L32_16835 [Undibacterium sp. CY18W]|uniref:Bacteriophage lambda head decoration protein D n=1 Tax=Undibacterium hunanense TaxID=2762292 RepID=A0ABR6ZTH2_9BURK|nr:hypothetical protein [Undibacterium hunanense]MBC3919160.1 hypothetical protein [Undibacterium hunanense]
MTNPYYAQTGAPVAQSRGASTSIRSEFGLVATGFDNVLAALTTKGSIAGQTWAGTHDYSGTTLKVQTRPAADNSTNAASTAYVDAATAVLAVAQALLASLNSPALTGIPTAPTAAPGTNTNQIATMAALAVQAMNAALPAQSAATTGQVPVSDGASATWGDLSNVGADIYLYNHY